MVDIASGTVVYGLQAFSAELSCRVFSLVLNSSTQEKNGRQTLFGSPSAIQTSYL